MDWKKLLKSIGIALACVGLIELVLVIIILGRKYPIPVFSAIAFVSLVAYIYNKS